MAEEVKENGEPKISKKAAKKAEKKAEKAVKKAAIPPKAPKEHVKPLVVASDSTDIDPMDHTCSVGWLRDVYAINAAGQGTTTRFPPEPNGFLHIGHAKAIAVNFGFAKYHDGRCYLRYDDTNPAGEEERYFNSIKESIEWLGYTPYKVTHSSDHFDELYDLAEKLIQKDRAYVCFCTQAEIKLQKGGDDNKGPRFACEHRTKPVEQSLEEFRKMRDGKYEARKAVLRMKMKFPESGNPYMWDLPAYRILETDKRNHHKTEDKWCIYPTYDFTHCLCDSFEKITHSLCTTEFQIARESYDWLLNELKEFLPAIPQQREYGRLRVTGTLLSKRKINALIENQKVRGWDDPRLYTLIGLRRRGIPPGAIRAFVAELGVSDALTTIQTVRLETTVRKYLEKTVPRLMLIPDPIHVTITNLPADHIEEISMDFMRGDSKMGSHIVPFTNKIFIDRSDFREVDSSDFFRLAPGKTVGLLNVPFPIKATHFDKDESTGLVTHIQATYEKPEDGSAPVKPKAFIQWVAESPAHKSPVKAEARFFNPLFKSDDPDAAEEGYLNDINPKSEEIYPNAVIECGFDEIRKRAPWPKDHVENKHPGNWDVRFQGMRVAYFTLDSESTEDKIILNKIVSLKEDAEGTRGYTGVITLG